MIKAIIFDFFGVLVTEGFKRFCDEYFLNDPGKRRQAIELVTAHDWGKLSHEKYVSELARLAGVSEDIVHAHMGDNQPNEILLEYIKRELKPRYKIGVLSNAGDDYIHQILSSDHAKLFDDIVLSYRHGMVKPQAEIFEFAAGRLGVNLDECVFVDDSSSHCAGARAVGMQAIWYKDFGQMKRELEGILSSSANE